MTVSRDDLWKEPPMRALTALLLAALTLALAPSARAVSSPALILRVSRQVFGPHARVAYCIARYESRWDPRAVSRGGGNYGAWQINVVHRNWLDWGRILDPVYNARAAFRLSRGGTDWGPWSTHRLCNV